MPQPRAEALAVALVVGDRQYLTDGQWHQLLVTGTNHLVAISGLHVSLLAGAVWLLVGFLWRGFPALANRYPARLAGAWPALLAAVAYAMLAGFSLPTQRAVLMFAVLAVALLLRRSLHAGQCLLAAITLMLLHDPLAPANPTFWLSTLAVAALVIVALGWRRAPLQGWLRSQLALLVVLAPATAYWFGQIAWVAPLANALAVPLVGALAVPVLLLGALLLPAWPAASEFLWQWGGWMLLGLDGLTGWLASLVDLHRTADGLPWWLAMAGMIGALLVIMPRHFPGRLLALPLLMPLLLVSDTGLPAQRAEVTLFDVGHGHAMRVRTRDHILWLDSGPAGWNASVDALAAGTVLAYSRARAGYKGGFDAAGVPARSLCELTGRWEWNGVRFHVINLSGSGCALLVHANGESLFALQGLERPMSAGDLARFHDRMDIVIMPGHGHRDLGAAMLSRLHETSDVLVSTNADNRWGLPHQEVRDAATAAGARLWVTGCAGAVRVMLGSGRGVRAPEGGRYWWRQARGQNCEP